MSVPFKRKRINMRAPLTFSWNNFQNKSGDLMRFVEQANERAIQNLKHDHVLSSSKLNQIVFRVQSLYKK